MPSITNFECSQSDIRVVNLVKNYEYPDEDGEPADFAFEGDIAGRLYECVNCGEVFGPKSDMQHDIREAWQEVLAHLPAREVVV